MDIYLEVVGIILKKRSLKMPDLNISNFLVMNDYSEDVIDKAFNAVETDNIMQVESLPFLTPVSPIVYLFGAKRILKEIRSFWGLLRSSKDISIRSIDAVYINNGIFSSDVSLINLDKSQIVISNISKNDSIRIRRLYTDVIEAQRGKCL